MWYRLSIAASTALIMGSVSAAAAELPTYETQGFPMSPHQLATLGAAGATEQAPVAAPELAGMPATPVQIAVLGRRGKADQTTTGSIGRTTGMARLTDQSR